MILSGKDIILILCIIVATSKLLDEYGGKKNKIASVTPGML